MNSLKLFKKLVSIDSVSGEEKDISDFVCDFLRKLNLNPIQDKHNMIYCQIGDGKNPKLFSAHLDTVEPGRNIKIVEKDGYLMSDGKTILGGDNKVSLALILSNIEKLLNNKKNLNLELLFTVREETNSGILDFDVKKLRSKIGFMFDLVQKNLGVVTQSGPTIQDVEIYLTGKSAHASRPNEGINTLKFLLGIGKKLKLGQLDEFSTFNLGVIKGGSATNTVPKYLELRGDLRSLDHETFLKHKNDIEKAFKSNKINATKVEIKWIPYSFAYNLDFKNFPMFEKIKNIYKNFQINLKPHQAKSGSDASFLNFNKIPTLCLSDGVENPHTINERINLENFYRLESIIKNLMLMDYISNTI